MAEVSAGRAVMARHGRAPWSPGNQASTQVHRRDPRGPIAAKDVLGIASVGTDPAPLACGEEEADLPMITAKPANNAEGALEDRVERRIGWIRQHG